MHGKCILQAHPVRGQEQTKKLNRNYSLTERYENVFTKFKP